MSIKSEVVNRQDSDHLPTNMCMQFLIAWIITSSTNKVFSLSLSLEVEQV